MNKLLLAGIMISLALGGFILKSFSSFNIILTIIASIAVVSMVILSFKIKGIYDKMRVLKYAGITLLFYLGDTLVTAYLIEIMNLPISNELNLIAVIMHNYFGWFAWIMMFIFSSILIFSLFRYIEIKEPNNLLFCSAILWICSSFAILNNLMYVS